MSVISKPKISVISNMIVISLFLNDLSSNLILEVKIKSLFISIAQKLIFFIICFRQESFDLDFGHFLAKNVL